MTPIEFVDRVAGKPGRVRITPEDGSAAYYAVIERADDSTVVGTPVNAASMNAAQETLVYEDAVGAHTMKRVYVATDGNDANSGDSADTPMATIKAAIRKYAKWHKYMDIYLADGTYTEDIGTISTDNCSLAIRSSSADKDTVTIHMATMLEAHINQLRLYNITMTMTQAGIRLLSINAGQAYLSNVRVNMPEASGSACINVYNGASAFLSGCILNSGTNAAVYGNQAMYIRAYNCTSERTNALAFYANNGTVIEYTDTVTATTMTKESNHGKCINLTARAGATKGAMASLAGQYMTYDGLLIQWGTISITPSAASVATTGVVTFPLPYAQTPLVYVTPVTAVPQNLSVGVLRSGDSVTNANAQVAVVLVRNGVTATSINWLAIGKGA